MSDELRVLEGRELDAAVAERVMGYVWSDEAPHKGELIPADGSADYIAGRGPLSHVRRYSSDIAAAWEVVARMLSLGWHLNLMSLKRDGTLWSAQFEAGIDTPITTRAPTAPLAICRAALSAFEGSDDDD